MTRDLGSPRGSSTSPRLDSRLSESSYIDYRFSRQNSQPYRPSFSEGYNSDSDYIDICFPRENEAHPDAHPKGNSVEELQGLQAQSREHEAHRIDNPKEKLQGRQAQSREHGAHPTDSRVEELQGSQAQSREHGTHPFDSLVEKLQGLQAQSDAVDSNQSAKSTEDNAPTSTGLKLLENDLKEKRFLRVSEESLRVDVEDFYNSLTIGLDSLRGLAKSFFLTAEFTQQSINLLQTLDSDVKTLLRKLSDVRGSSSEDFCCALLEYTSMSAKILEVCNALKFSTTLLNAYQRSRAEASVLAVEALVALPKSTPRAVHISMAEEAGQCIDSAHAEMIQMQGEVKKLIESSNYGGFSYLVPNLNIMNPQSHFARWSGLRGVLFAMKAASFYISQLLLAGLAHAGEGPSIILSSTNLGSFNSAWATSLVDLHIQVRKEFNKMKDSSRGSCSFMSRDNNLLEFMLHDTKGHLQSLLDQGKFLNIGVYIGSWQTDRKKLVHNVPRLRHHLLLVRHLLSKVVQSIESLAGSMSDIGYLDQLQQAT